MRATRVSAPGGRRTAGLLLGLLCLVGLAAIPATTSVLADDTKADGPKGLRGGEAAGEAREGLPLRGTGDAAVVENGGSAEEGGFLSAAKTGTGRRRDQEDLRASGELGDGTGEEPAPLTAPREEGELPAGVAEKSRAGPQSRGSEISAGSSDAGQQLASHGGGEENQRHLPSPSLSSAASTTTTTSPATTGAGAARGAASAVTSSNTDQGGKDQKNELVPSESSAATVAAGTAATTTHESVDGMRAMSRAISRGGEEGLSHPSPRSDSTPTTTATSTVPASESVNNVQARTKQDVSAEVSQTAPRPNAGKSGAEVGSVSGGTAEDAGGREDEVTPPGPGSQGGSGAGAGPGGAVQDNGVQELPEDNVEEDRTESQTQGGSGHQAGQEGEPGAQGPAEGQEEPNQNEEPPQQGHTSPSSTTTSTTATSASTRAVSRNSWCTILGVLTVLPFLVTA